MSKARTILLPAEKEGWEVWVCSGQSCSLKKIVNSPEEARAAGPGTVFAVPSRYCRTIGLSLPTNNPAVVRKMAFSQLERRGLARGAIEDTLFDCHLLPGTGSADEELSRVSVDVLTNMPDEFRLSNARAYTAAPRLFPLPEGKLVLWQEHGQLVLSASRAGKLTHSQVLGAMSRLKNGAAGEINLTRMALEGEGLVDEDVRGLEVWGEIDASDLDAFRGGLDLPVEQNPRPGPSAALASSETDGRLVPDSVLQTRKRHRRTWMTFCLLVALAMAYVVVLYRLKSRVEAMEAGIPSLEMQVNQTKDVAEQVKRAQERWNTLRPVLEPRRYPLVHLSHIARVMPRGGVRIDNFESKIKEVTVSGQARDAASAYEMLRLLQQEEELNVYNWSMPQPGLSRDAQATFEIKGKLR